MKFSIFNIIKTIRFKFTFVALATLVIVSCFAIALSRFNSTDPEPAVKNIGVEQTKEFAAFTVHVETGLFIRNFSYFNMIENKFVVDLVVWFLFNPDEITLDAIEKFSFENGKITKKSSSDIKIIDDKMFVKYNVIVELKSNLEYYRFPLEDHKLSIVLTNNFVTPYEVMFEVLSTDFVVNPHVFVSNWVIKKLDTNFGIDEDILNQIDQTKKIAYPKAVFSMDFVKAGIRKTFIIFAPIFLVFFFSLFSFFLNVANVIGRTTLAVSALTALLGYRFVIERMMPKIGYFTTTDYVYIILLTFSFLTFIFHVIVTPLYHATQRRKEPVASKVRLLDRIKDIIFIIITLLATIMLGFVVIL